MLFQYKIMDMDYRLIFLLLLLFSHCKSQDTQSTSESKLSNLSKLKELVNSQDYPNIDAILVSHHNELLVEEYFNGFEKGNLHDTRSAFKSITSLLTGIAIDQGLFVLDDKLQRFLPEWKNDPRGQISIQHLLEMKSGLDCECFFEIGPCCESEMWDTDNWLNYILNISLRHEPGMNWAYTSVEPELLGVIIQRTSKMTIVEFADNYLFEPLNIKEVDWFLSPEGRGYAAGSFNMKPLDMLKIAQLVLDKGNWKGQQIVSENWISRSTDCKTDVDMSFVRYARTQNAKYSSAKYGFMWYEEKLQFGEINTRVLFASGNGGQYMMLLKDYDAAVVFSGSNYGNWRGKLPFDILLKYLMPLLEKS